MYTKHSPQAIPQLGSPNYVTSLLATYHAVLYTSEYWASSSFAFEPMLHAVYGRRDGGGGGRRLSGFI